MLIQRDLSYYLNEVNYLLDGLGLPIDPLIKRPVAILMYVGFPTDGSYQGHLDRGNAFPWININSYNNAPDIYYLEYIKIQNDHLLAAKLAADNLIYLRKMLNLLERSHFSDKIKICHFGNLNDFRIEGIGENLNLAQQSMMYFTEWILEDYNRYM